MSSEEILLLAKIIEALKNIGEKLGVPVEVEYPPTPPPPAPPEIPRSIVEALQQVLDRIKDVLDLYTPHTDYISVEPSVTKQEPYELDVAETIGRRATRGYIINDGSSDVYVIFNRMLTRKIRVKPGEQLDISNLRILVEYLRIETASTTSVPIRLLLV